MADARKANKIPWNDMITDNLWYRAYRDTDADGNLTRYVFVIKDKNGSGLSYAVHSCLLLAFAHQTSCEWESYAINVPVGIGAGQEIDQFYVELKPMRKSNA